MNAQKINWRRFGPSAVARLVCAWVVLGAFAADYGEYFTFLRWVTFAVCGYTALVAREQKRVGWLWTFGILAAVFNPILPVRLGASLWSWVDLFAIGLLIASLFTIKEYKQEAPRKRLTFWEISGMAIGASMFLVMLVALIGGISLLVWYIGWLDENFFWQLVSAFVGIVTIPLIPFAIIGEWI